MTGAEALLQETNNCILHPFETADRVCHQCGHWHCDGCLVTPWGPRKPALCIECAIGRSGVRRSAASAPARPAKEIRAIEKASRQSRNRERQARTLQSGGISLPPPRIEVQIDQPAPEPEPPAPERRSLLSRLRSA